MKTTPQVATVDRIIFTDEQGREVACIPNPSDEDSENATFDGRAFEFVPAGCVPSIYAEDAHVEVEPAHGATPLQLRSPSDIQALLRDWEGNGTWEWNPEDVPGFELHREELRAHRLAWAARAEKKAQEAEARAHDERLTLAEQMGVPGAEELMRFIMRLSSRIQALEDRVSILKPEALHDR